MRRRNQSPHHSGGANRPPHSGGGHNRPRRYNNNTSSRPGGYNAGPDSQGDGASVSRTRRHATMQREKYYNMARDTLSGGDRVQAEYYFQHVEHYTRVLNELPPEEVRPPNRYNNPPSGNYRDQNAQNGDGNDNAETQQQNTGSQDGNQNGNGNDNGGNNNYQQERDDAPTPAASALPAFITTPPRPRPQSANPAPMRDTDEG